MPAGRTNLNQTAHPSLSPFPLSPVSSRCPHRTSSSVTSGGGCGRRGSGQAGGDEGGSRSGRFAELSSRSSQLLVHVQKLWCAFMRVCVFIRALTSAAVCDFVFISSGGLLSCCSFFSLSFFFFFFLSVLTPCSVRWRPFMVRSWMGAASCQLHCLYFWVSTSSGK